MYLSLHEDMLGNVPLSTKFQWAREAGFDGIDVRGDLLTRRIRDLRSLSEKTGIQVAAVYGRLGIPLVSRSIDARRESLSILKARIRDARQAGVDKVIVVPVFGEARITVAREAGVRDVELSLLVILLDELAQYAEQYQVDVVLEPLNRNETHLLTSPSETATLCQQIGNGRVKTMVDTYHVDLNGQGLTDEIAGCAQSLGLIHLSNRNRGLPGPAGIDFGQGLQYLKQIEYDGFLGFECTGPFTVEELVASSSWVRACLNRS